MRTPMGSFNGVFGSVPATKLGSIAIAEALKRVHVLPEHVDDVLMGCVLSAAPWVRRPPGKPQSELEYPIQLAPRQSTRCADPALRR